MNIDAVPMNCPVCGKGYSALRCRLRQGKKTTCSRGCSYILRAKSRETKVRMNCSACGREFERHPSHVKGKHGGHFCSRACHYAGRGLGLSGRVVEKPYVISEEARIAWLAGAVKTVATRRKGDNYIKSDETRAKLSIATTRALAEGKVGRPSKAEDEAAAILLEIDPSIVRQFAFREGDGRFGFVADFWLPATRSVIEFNGTYWHGDPRVYPTPRNDMQSRCIRKYARKLDALAALNIPVAEIWELDFKQDPTKAVLEAYARATVG